MTSRAGNIPRRHHFYPAPMKSAALTNTPSEIEGQVSTTEEDVYYYNLQGADNLFSEDTGKGPPLYGQVGGGPL